MDYGCIARKLGHSFSAEIHKLIGDYDYRLREVSEDELAGFMTRRDFKGINVTIPYKKDVITYLDEISDTARRIGSVNTVVNRGGRLYGYNTDCAGMKALISHAGISLEGKTVLVLGTGGTSATANVVARDLGAGEVLTVSRRPSEGVITYEQATGEYSHAEIIINTTPVGMFPKNYASPIDVTKFSKLEGVVDAVFNPLRTELVLNARKMGVKAVGGLYMLVAQAVYASEIFRDVKIPKTEIDRIYRELMRQKESIVLIGMPGSGKSTIGRLVAERLNREFLDTDSEIVAREGMEITDIFRQKGESAFRDIETDVLKDTVRRSGIVLATGGGVILREENVGALRQNCKVFFLDRDLNWLTPTSDRPTASDKEALRKRYEERYNRYVEAADIVVKPVQDKAENAEIIIREFLK